MTGGSPGLVVMGDNSYSRGRVGSNSSAGYRIHVTFFTSICSKNVLFVWKNRKNYTFFCLQIKNKLEPWSLLFCKNNNNALIFSELANFNMHRCFDVNSWMAWRERSDSSPTTSLRCGTNYAWRRTQVGQGHAIG